jgi:hypothetical protein
VADIPKDYDQPHEKRFDYNYKENRLNNRGEFISALNEADFDKALEATAERLRIESDFILKREEYIKKQLEEKLPEFIAADDSLKNKKKINVTITLGHMHTHLAAELRKSGNQIKVEFGKKPTIFSPEYEGKRRELFDKKQDRELLSQVMVEEFFDFGIRFEAIAQKVTSDNVKVGNFVSKCMRRCSEQDAKKIFNEFAKYKGLRDFKKSYLDKNLSGEEAKTINKVFYVYCQELGIDSDSTDVDELKISDLVFKKYLQEHDIPKPETEEELDKFLSE